MSRQPLKIPSYRRHKQSGQAIVTLTDGAGDRHDVLLGRHGTAESRAEYARVIAEWEANGRRLARPLSRIKDISVNELILTYYRHAETYYLKNGEPTSQLERVRRSLRFVKELYGHTLTRDFGPLSLKAVRDQMIRADWSRVHINSCVGCVKRMFKWGVENELVPPSVFHGLQAVVGLRKGRSSAREGKKIQPVSAEHVEATLPRLRPTVQTMVQLQRLSGMRPGEVVIMRPCDLDQSRGNVWLYRPESHKTEHHGVERVVLLGPQAQELIFPYLEGRAPGAYLFSPRESMTAWRAEQRTQRQTKVQPSQVNRKKRRPQKQPGDRYLVCSYAQAIRKACQKANVPHWHPHQLRHAAATEIRKEAGLDAARAVLGHRSPAITETYAEIDLGKAAEVMERLG